MSDTKTPFGTVDNVYRSRHQVFLFNKLTLLTYTGEQYVNNVNLNVKKIFEFLN